MEPIDLCICVSGPLVDVLLPIALETLHRHDKLDDVRLHIISKGCSDAVEKYLLALGISDQAEIRHFSSPERPKDEKRPWLGDAMEAERDVVNGTVTTLDWMVKNCGHSRWVFVMHFDIEFKAPWLSYYRGKIAEGVGQIGDHAVGMVGYNRNAVRQAEVGFHSMSGCFVTKDHYGNTKIRHGSDVRCVDKTNPLCGWDTNELLELNLQHWGWKVIIETDDASQVWRTHHGSGSGRCGDGANTLIRQRASADLRRLGILPIT